MGQCWRIGDRCPRGPIGCRPTDDCQARPGVCLTLARLDDPQPATCQHPVIYNSPLSWFTLSVDPPCRNGESWCWGQGTFNLGVCHDFYFDFSRWADYEKRAS
jgi:hypothetical protein